MIAKTVIQGKEIFKYLIPITIKINKFEYPIVINMSNDSANYVGMDLVISAGMNMDFIKLKYEVFPPASKVPPSFDLMKIEDILKYFNLDNNDLIKTNLLPIEITSNEYKKTAIDLGEGYLYQSIKNQHRINGPQF